MTDYPQHFPEKIEYPTILPCPFCGTAPHLYRHHMLMQEENLYGHPMPTAWIEMNHTIRCDECGIEITEEYESEVIEKWNQRGQNAVLQQILDEIGEFDQFCKEGEYTDTDRVWELLNKWSELIEKQGLKEKEKEPGN